MNWENMIDVYNELNSYRRNEDIYHKKYLQMINLYKAVRKSISLEDIEITPEVYIEKQLDFIEEKEFQV
jgi:hypothetical protein